MTTTTQISPTLGIVRTSAWPAMDRWQWSVEYNRGLHAGSAATEAEAGEAIRETIAILENDYRRAA